jgi:hypothetical protein
MEISQTCPCQVAPQSEHHMAIVISNGTEYLKYMEFNI